MNARAPPPWVSTLERYKNACTAHLFFGKLGAAPFHLYLGSDLGHDPRSHTIFFPGYRHWSAIKMHAYHKRCDCPSLKDSP